MSWLVPLGFLGLIGLAVLLLIYLLKPNYQQKSVSSTFIWKLSLKYKKRRNPISKLRNLLILLCQIIIIAACAFVMAQPAIAKETSATSDEKIVIIDASASMLASNGDDSRFERAVQSAAAYVESSLNSDNTVSVILAGREAEYLAFRINSKSEEAETIIDKMKELIADPLDLKCSYGAGDLDGAKNLAEEITIDNPLAEVLLYTGTTYLDKGKVKVVNVSEKDEWNIAVLDSSTDFIENFYSFRAEVAAYGRAQEVTVICEVDGINKDPTHPDGLKDRYTVTSQIPKDSSIEIVFDPAELGRYKVSSFTNARIMVEVDDSFPYDNTFDIYGGMIEEIKIQYYSSLPNIFFKFALSSLQDAFSDKWSISITEVGDRDSLEIEGYDIYIFEHSMPAVLPTDGLVILADPDVMPHGVEMTIDSISTTTASAPFVFTEGEEHVITQFVDVSKFICTQYSRIVEWNDGIYTPLMYCNGDPVLLCQNTPDTKLVVMAFSVNMTTPDLFDFSALIYGIYDYFMPSTTDSYAYDVNEEITINARGSKLEVFGQTGGEPIVYESFPAKLLLEKSGSYILKQKLISGREVTESIFVRIPNDESNIVKVVQVLPGPIKSDATETVFDMHILYIILGIAVGLMFVEWFLHSRTGA